MMKHSINTNNWASYFMTQWTKRNRHAHTTYTVLWSEACLPNHVKNQIHKDKISINCTNYSTLCLSKTTQFPHKAQDLPTTIMYQWQVTYLLLATTTHSLPILPHKGVDR